MVEAPEIIRVPTLPAPEEPNAPVVVGCIPDMTEAERMIIYRPDVLRSLPPEVVSCLAGLLEENAQMGFEVARQDLLNS